MSQLYFSSKKRNNGSILQIRGHYYANNRNDCFQPIGQLSPISFSVVKGNQLLITLNVPDTWCDKAGDGAWFAISVNDEIKSRGVYYSGKDGQRVPITLQTVVDVEEDHSYIIKGLWCNESGTENRNCNIGEFSETVLTVLVLD